MYGGDGGAPFEDSSTSAYLQQVRIRCAARVDSLECVYDNGSKSGYHGGEGGKDYIFFLDKNEAIITVNIWAGARIDAIQFQTTKGRISEKYGGSGGSPYVCRGFVGRERALVGFKGRSASEIDALEPIWSDERDLGTTTVSIGEPRGGWGGSPFDMLQSIGDPLKTALKAVVVRSAARIDAIECKYQGDKSSGRQGGDGGGERIFVLGDDERIIRIEGRAGERIDQLEFFTNTDRRSGTFGGDGGSAFVWTPPSTGINMSLLCFQGQSAREIDRLAPVWAVDPPIRFELDIKEFETPSPDLIGKPKEAWTTEKTTENNTQNSVQSKFAWQMSATKSTTVTVSEESRSKIGGKFTMSVTVKGKAGVPLLAESGVSATAGIEVNGEKEWGKSVTDGNSLTDTFTESLDETITVPAYTRTKGRAVGYRVEVHSLKWSGVMTITYAGGSKKQFDINGTFDSASATKIHTKYTEEPITK